MASGKVRLFSAVCCLLILSAFIDSTHSASCCLSYIRRPKSCQVMLGYTIQTITQSCDINAVIFHVHGRFLCADPRAAWTRIGMKCIDDRKTATFPSS
ncbi:C-C motif chemokine 20b [Synchiropus splendidus]|uniref:C-C motif chemokine 20b n=1 Tax=Synchiropus splendidus TaxID=270530 RepID=UPI00237D873A|nr:C-C motif chemokine 20b [Synchiropus splendidus]